ncbi:type II glyceraldehyde-3-phosphate dehydrogenase [Halomicrobium sp. HM KBTZ05]|uniref:Glyceraldehyde-3-phosphate dehydrogenase n=1 Tax=Halomicrobium mukohataei TaxID=57705 RepID=A0A847U892_9EURY|nr:type II glyceraldehyde-3-phosphate dehydrogenase [Halomicrobium mukohataei]NLV08776.1 type II glyceraldehyde-3-phosphate dehydrogenase [Halomicrobium mukohataei]
MLRVGINGFGTIGKRVADAVRAQPDMTVAGVAKRTPDYEAEIARDRGYSLFAAAETTPFTAAGIDVAGQVRQLVAASDVVVDATPAGVGERNRALYEELETPAIYQGGEDASVAPVSFNARANYDEAVGADAARVVSCNTTGLSRVLAPLEERYGIEKVRATLVRRGGDPSQTGRGPINDTLPDPVSIPSHHAPDVKTVFPELSIDTMGMKVPATLMHTHAINLTLRATPTAEDVRELLTAEGRLLVIPERLGIDGAGKLKEYTRDAGRPRGDVWENCIWAESLTVEPLSDDRADCYLFQAIHQEADVVPENVDAIRAIAGLADGPESVERTNEALGIGCGLAGIEPDTTVPTRDAASDD